MKIARLSIRGSPVLSQSLKAAGAKKYGHAPTSIVDHVRTVLDKID